MCSGGGELLINWIRQLKRAFPAFVGSRRWRMGNATVRMAEMVLLRPEGAISHGAHGIHI